MFRGLVSLTFSLLVEGLVVVLITVAAVVQAVTCTLLKPIYLSILGQ